MQDGTAVAMTETVQGTLRVDPGTLRTLGQVGARDLRGGASLLQCMPCSVTVYGLRVPGRLWPHRTM